MTDAEDLLHTAFTILVNAQPLILGQHLVSGDGLEHGFSEQTILEVDAAIDRFIDRYHEHLRETQIVATLVDSGADRPVERPSRERLDRLNDLTDRDPTWSRED